MNGIATHQMRWHAHLDYFARMNTILQKTQKVDIAIYYDTYEDEYMTAGGDGDDRYPDNGVLNAMGYSYEFVSPETLELPSAIVTDHILNADGPAYKAIIVHHQQYMDKDDLNKLYDLAKAGLPIVFVGEMPSAEKYFANATEQADEELSNICEQMNALENVSIAVDYANVPDTLLDLAVVPDAAYEQPADVLAKHTTDGYGDYYYLYNYNKASGNDVNATAATEGTVYPNLNKDSLQEETVTVSLQGSGYPYELDAWSGAIIPIADYTATDDIVSVTVSLDKDDAKLIMLLPDLSADAADIHSEGSSIDVEYIDGQLVAKTTDAGETEITLSNGETVKVEESQIQESFAIESWNLDIDSIEQGDTIYFRDSAWKTINVGEITELKGWNQLGEELTSVSGVGHYTASFTLENGWEEKAGAYIDLGEVEDIFTVTINGEMIPFTNQVSTKIDIGPYVTSGENTIEVTVASTLYNYAYSIGSVRGTSGDEGLHPLFENGLIGREGSVEITPYRVVNLNK